MNIGKIGKIIISSNLKKQIDYYHKKIQGKEWSGVLFYKQIKGDFDKLSDLEFVATNIFLMDIGSGTYTNFENDGDVIDAFNKIGDDGLESLMGFCHSHHNMKAWFSNTDLEELKDNAPNYNFFVSLIVNTLEEYVCKIVIPSETTSTHEHIIRDFNGKLKKVKQELKETILIEGDLEVVIENKTTVPEWVENRIKEIEDKKEKARISKQKTTNHLTEGYAEDYWGRSTKWNSWSDYKEPEITRFSNNNSFKPDTKGKLFNEFLKCLLYLDVNPPVDASIADVLITIEEMNDTDWKIYSEAIAFNLDIMYDNIFKNTDISFEYVFNELVEFINEQKATERMLSLLEVIDSDYVDLIEDEL
ncbi:MAG: hypothetical protein EOM21_20230 [Gammaproteobacteria bacterium]|nr:hypothetical protein [Gammaproteobacteria bacterium]